MTSCVHQEEQFTILGSARGMQMANWLERWIGRLIERRDKKFLERLDAFGKKLENELSSGKNFQEIELEKLRSAATNNPRVRKAIGTHLRDTIRRLEEAGRIDETHLDHAQWKLMNEAAAERRRAPQIGNDPYNSPTWAAPSASETWLQILIFQKRNQLDEETYSRLKEIVGELAKG